MTCDHFCAEPYQAPESAAGNVQGTRQQLSPAAETLLACSRGIPVCSASATESLHPSTTNKTQRTPLKNQISRRIRADRPCIAHEVAMIHLAYSPRLNNVLQIPQPPACPSLLTSHSHSQPRSEPRRLRSIPTATACIAARIPQTYEK